MGVDINGAENNRHYLVSAHFQFLFLKSEPEVHNFVLHLPNVYVTICIVYVHTKKC